MRQILENSQNRLISLKEEVDALKLYVELELIRFRDNFDFRFEIDDELQLRNIFVPPLILQPYVENAIHHGLIHKTGSKELVVRIVSENDFVTIEIRDNGIGRKNAEEIKRRKANTYKSMGMDITTKRVELFKTIYSNKISVEINDLTDDRNMPEGTSVKITLTNNDNDF
jgi:LytS/YehU family sensor histidine kinase